MAWLDSERKDGVRHLDDSLQLAFVPVKQLSGGLVETQSIEPISVTISNWNISIQCYVWGSHAS